MMDHFYEYLHARMEKARWKSPTITPRRMDKLNRWARDFAESYGVFVRVLIDVGTGKIAVQIEERDVREA